MVTAWWCCGDIAPWSSGSYARMATSTLADRLRGGDGLHRVGRRGVPADHLLPAGLGLPVGPHAARHARDRDRPGGRDAGDAARRSGARRRGALGPIPPLLRDLRCLGPLLLPLVVGSGAVDALPVHLGR